jgi:hypothetical protein
MYDAMCLPLQHHSEELCCIKTLARKEAFSDSAGSPAEPENKTARVTRKSYKFIFKFLCLDREKDP